MYIFGILNLTFRARGSLRRRDAANGSFYFSQPDARAAGFGMFCFPARGSFVGACTANVPGAVLAPCYILTFFYYSPVGSLLGATLLRGFMHRGYRRSHRLRLSGLHRRHSW